MGEYAKYGFDQFSVDAFKIIDQQCSSLDTGESSVDDSDLIS